MGLGKECPWWFTQFAQILSLMSLWLLPFDDSCIQSLLLQLVSIKVCIKSCKKTRNCLCKVKVWLVKETWRRKSEFFSSHCYNRGQYNNQTKKQVKWHHIITSAPQISFPTSVHWGISSNCVLFVSNFYRGSRRKASKPRGQGPMCWWIMGFHCARCCWQALLVGRMSL